MTSIALGSLFGPSHAADVSWTGGTGDWSDGANWGGSVPGVLDSARIENGGTAQVTDSQTVDRVFPGFNANTTGTVTVLPGGILTSNSTTNIGQGSNSVGTLNVNGGTFIANSTGTGIDGAVPGTANVNLTSGTLINKGIWNASRSGTWNFNFTGGNLASKQINGSAGMVIDFDGTTITPGDVGVAGRMTTATAAINMTTNSHTQIDIGGTNVATGSVYQDPAGFYDLVFSGNSSITVGGDLEVSFIDGFAGSISNSDTFNIIQSNASGDRILGSFDNVTFGARLNTSGGEGSFLVTLVNNQFVRLSDYQAIPEASHFALTGGLLALAALVILRKRISH
ncbi:hypothetical protein [Rubellicoccus peritrichatus]|uniref:Uncharacterized protein n=1 Tax=Rubellicoccus peritrichatus TaxID=3080537 RepID=A0AAQ3L6F3_9BACT|nr:hypothetical protein [Puniceicoccus sp. CR14]WOO39926.1 hypothetical protein RZN69_14970 [Puniceicoccus sp. CR14]